MILETPTSIGASMNDCGGAPARGQTAPRGLTGSRPRPAPVRPRQGRRGGRPGGTQARGQTAPLAALPGTEGRPPGPAWALGGSSCLHPRLAGPGSRLGLSTRMRPARTPRRRHSTHKPAPGPAARGLPPQQSGLAVCLAIRSYHSSHSSHTPPEMSNSRHHGGTRRPTVNHTSSSRMNWAYGSNELDV